MKKIYCVTCGQNRKLKNLKVLYIFVKTLVLSIFTVTVKMTMKKLFKEVKLIEILNILSLIKNITLNQKKSK